jgi:hypothetical protein
MVIHPNNLATCVTVFANQSGTISIQQCDFEHGGGTVVTIDPGDIEDLVHALRCVAQEIEGDQCPRE